MKKLRLILGDQLNEQHSWFSEVNDQHFYLIMEMRQETGYVLHHIQKLVGFFAAMEQFAGMLQSKGHQVIHLRFDNPENTGDLIKNLNHLIAKNQIEQLEYLLPDEYRLDAQLKSFADKAPVPVIACDSEHFLTERNELEIFFSGKKQYLMESFYRMMRKKWKVLMEGSEPAGGQWNFDHDNRQKMDADVKLPPKSMVTSDVSSVYKRIQDAGIESFGKIKPDEYMWPLNRLQALKVLEEFIAFRLPLFGTYQDAMTDRDAFLFHSRISFALNVKLLHPMEVITKCVEDFHNNPGRVSMNQLEGFVRQILGWREYMRGIYWMKMPNYANLNFFNHNRSLPSWFWNGDTKMKCLQHSIGQSLDHAYAHHIQRLMVIGNFALLAGLSPDELDGWYLGVYIDAIEWVEITNTRGMSQFADGGIVGSKPYTSSGAYIKKMGSYCDGCYYDHKAKLGTNACPFNSLYWHFHARHREKLERNPRIGMMYRTWDRMEDSDKKAILDQAEKHLLALNEL
jgi:deoxyribodipyrimidine photolyase-related protein